MKFSQTILVALVAAMSTNNALGRHESLDDCLEDVDEEYYECKDIAVDRYERCKERADDQCWEWHHDDHKILLDGCRQERHDWCRETRDEVEDECDDKKWDGQDECRKRHGNHQVSGWGRRLQEVQISEVASHACSSQNYGLSVFVEAGHVVLTGEPNCDGSIRNSMCQECPSLAFHTTTTKVGKEKHLEKAIHEYQVNDSDEKFGLGIFTLGELAEAYGGASVGTSMKYSLLKNNCASFLIEVLQKLGVNPTNRKLIKYVSRKLTENAQPKIMRELSKHEEGLAMIHEHNEESAVIENFVSNYIEDRVD